MCIFHKIKAMDVPCWAAVDLSLPYEVCDGKASHAA